MPGKATLNPAEALRAAAAPVAPIPLGGDGEPVFAEPWQATAFAMTLALHERGLFTWPEWAASLAERIRDAQAEGDPDDGSTYYQHWLAALEHVVIHHRVVSSTQLEERRASWRRAARTTPHGQPIVLANDPGPR
jgi:nitrile hydratase accessory protein